MSDVHTKSLMVQVPVTLEITLDLVVTNTLTSTVPASVVLQLPDQTTTTLPVSVTVGILPDSEVVVELLPVEIVATETPTRCSALQHAVFSSLAFLTSRRLP